MAARPPEYVEWAQTKNGVTRVFVQRATPVPGAVTVYFMMDNIGDGHPVGPPTWTRCRRSSTRSRRPTPT